MSTVGSNLDGDTCDLWLPGFVAAKLQAAKHLGPGESIDGYQNAALLLCCLIDAISTAVWGGEAEKHNRKCFVETLVRYADKHLMADRISIPSAAQELRDRGRAKDAAVLEGAFLPPNHPYGPVLAGEDVDHPEDEILRLLPHLSVTHLRKQSYAWLLYKRLRCPGVHSLFTRDDSAHPYPMTRREVFISYVNVVKIATTGDQHFLRPIHFHYRWLEALVRSLATNLAEQVEHCDVTQPPSIWWLDGGPGE